jgi:predicted RNase H-like HicB family nuclease
VGTTAADPSESLIAAEAFAEAKARFSEVMDHTIHDHRIQMIDRHKGKERAVLLSLADLTVLLEALEFRPRVSVSEGTFVIRLPELNLISTGADLESALDELVELAEQQAEDFFDRLGFFLETDRRSQLPWHLKVAITEPEQRRALFSPGPPAEVREPAVPA